MQVIGVRAAVDLVSPIICVTCEAMLSTNVRGAANRVRLRREAVIRHRSGSLDPVMPALRVISPAELDVHQRLRRQKLISRRNFSRRNSHARNWPSITVVKCIIGGAGWRDCRYAEATMKHISGISVRLLVRRRNHVTGESWRLASGSLQQRARRPTHG